MYSLVDDLREHGSSIIEFCSGTLRDGRDFHTFVKMTPDNHAKYLEARQSGEVLDLPSFGEVLHTGWGREPDEAIKALITSNHTDNQKIQNELARQLKAMQANKQGDKNNGRIAEA